MRDFNRGSRDSRDGRNSRDGGRGFKKFGGRDNDRGFGRGSDRPSMHSAICDECGKECEIPFKPTAGKPVYCSNCFSKKSDKGDSRDSRDFRDRGFKKPRHEDRPLFEVVCDSCGKKCEVPFKPTAGKPVYCNDCFGKGGSEGKDKTNFKEQFEILNSKLDSILEKLGYDSSIKEIKKKINSKLEDALIEAPKKEEKKKEKKVTVKKKTVAKKKVATKKVTKKKK